MGKFHLEAMAKLAVNFWFHFFLPQEDDGSRNPAASNTWDDGAYSTIRRFVVYEREWICSIQIEYDLNGKSFWSPKHGENEGSISEVSQNEALD